MMPDRILTVLDPRGARARRDRLAFTLLEGLVVLLVMAILAGVAVVAFTSVRRSQLDRAGYPIIGAAQVDGRRVAAQQRLTFPDDLSRAMANSAAAADGRTISYVTGPSQDSEHVSVARGSAEAAGYAVMTSMQGSWSDGTASDGHCLMAVDSLSKGTTYATMTDAIRSGTNYCGAAFIAVCQPTDFTQGGAGTLEDPYLVNASTTCSGTTSDATLNAPKCVVATPVAATDGVSTRSARVTWVPGANTGQDFTYTVVAKGPTTVTVSGIDAGARTTQVDGLVAGQRYTFEVTVVAGANQSSVAASQPLLLVPAAPAVTTSSTSSAVTLAWAQVPGAQSYEVVRAPVFTDGTRKVLASAAVSGQLTLTDNTVTPDVDYTYSVTAITAEQQDTCVGPVTGGGRANSVPAIAGPDLAPPVLSVTNVAGDASALHVAWNPVPGAASYVLKATTVTNTWGGAPTRTIGQFPAGTTSVDDKDLALPAGTAPRYVTYELVAVTRAGATSQPSRRDVGLLPPDAPAISKAAPNAGTPTTALDVAWNATGDASSTYTVKRDGAQVRAAATSTTFTDTALDPGTTYSYEVVASNVRAIKVYPGDTSTKTVGATTTSEPYTGTTASAVGSLTVTPNQAARTFSVSWATVTGATGYVLEGSNDGQAWAPVSAAQSTTAGTVSVTDSIAGGFAPGQVRVYRLTVKGSVDTYAKPAASVLAPSYPVVSAAVTDGTGQVTVSGYATGATAVTVASNGVGTMGAPVLTPTSTGVVFTAANTGTAASSGTWTKYATRAQLVKQVNIAAFGGSPAKWPAASVTLRSDSTLAPLPAAVSSGAGVNTCAVSATVVGVAFPATSTTMGCLANGNGSSWASAVVPPQVESVTGRHDLAVTWTNPAALTSAVVTRTAGTSSTVVTTAGVSPVTDATTEDGTSYGYQVTVNVPARVGTAKSAVVTGLTVPPTPALTLRNLSADSLSAAFNRTKSANGFIVVPSGTVPLSYVGTLAAAQGKVTYYAGPKRGKVAIADPATTTPSVSLTSLPLEQRQIMAVYAVNAAGISDAGTDARCTAPMAPAAPRQDLTLKAKYGNQVTLLVPTRATPCVSQLSVTRKNLSTGAVTRDETSVRRSGGTEKYTASPVNAGQNYSFSVVAQGEGGSSAPATVTALAYSAYDVLIQKHNPDLYYTFDEGPGAVAIRNCANADCSVRSAADGTFDLATKASLARVKSPFAGSGFDPVNYAASFRNASKINAVDKDYQWPATNLTFESWVYTSSSKQVGIIAGWGNQNCEYGKRSTATCNGAAMGMGGKGTSSSSDADYKGFSSGVWGNALTGLATFNTSDKAGPRGGSRLDPRGGEGAERYLTANQWHLITFTVATVAPGRTELRHYVDGRAGAGCTTASGGTKWGEFVDDDYQWCTVRNISPWTPTAAYFKAHPELKGLTIGGYNRIAFNGNVENEYLEGLVDNVAVYRRVLTPAEMRRHFRVGQLFFTGGDTSQKTCQVADGCFDVSASFTGGGTVTNGKRTYTIRDRAVVTAYATGRVMDGNVAIDDKTLSNTAELQVRGADGIWVSPNASVGAVTANPVVNAGTTTATYTFSNVGWASAGSYTYRVVTRTQFGDVLGDPFTVNVAP